MWQIFLGPRNTMITFLTFSDYRPFFQPLSYNNQLSHKINLPRVLLVTPSLTSKDMSHCKQPLSPAVFDLNLCVREFLPTMLKIAFKKTKFSRDRIREESTGLKYSTHMIIKVVVK